ADTWRPVGSIVPVMLKSVNGPTLTRMVSCAPLLMRPGCAGSVLPVPIPGRLNDPLTRPVAPCDRLNEAPTSGPLVTSQLPDIVPTTNDRVSEVVAPFGSLTLSLATPSKPLMNVTVPAGPPTRLP